MICIKNQFPDFGKPLPKIEGFVDSSWFKNGAPSISKDLDKTSCLTVFIHYPNKENDFQIDGCKYKLFKQTNEDEFICESNDIEDIEQNINQILKGIKND
jgi:hypothetical protein